MQFYSTRNKKLKVELKEAVLNSLAPDGGLFMPESLDKLSDSFFANFKNRRFQENAFLIAKHLLGDSLEDQALEKIVYDAFNFDVPLIQLSDQIYSLELWHGPSLAFKDFGARFMSRLIAHFVKHQDQKQTILVATSGDTGGAVASGFAGIDNVEVVILYPKDKVSPLQELQLTTWGGNIKAIEIDGVFDDCQTIVKRAFLDEELNRLKNLSSANSINIARLIPQSFYYFEAIKQLDKGDEKVAISVPSGNFGNLCAGLIARKLGLSIDYFIAATNINKVVPEYLSSSIYKPKTSQSTISNAMDVGNPSNFERLMDMYNSDHSLITQDIYGYHYTDDQTKEALSAISRKYNYTADPHGAVGFLAINEFLLDRRDCQGIFLETAHPAKFLPVMETVLDQVSVPDSLRRLEYLEMSKQSLNNNYNEFKDWLLGQ